MPRKTEPPKELVEQWWVAAVAQSKGNYSIAKYVADRTEEYVRKRIALLIEERYNLRKAQEASIPVLCAFGDVINSFESGE